MTWRRPPEFSPGWTQGATVIIPDSGVVLPFEVPQAADPRILWSLPPAARMKVLFTVLFSEAMIDAIDSVLLPGDTVVGRLLLPSGSSVWVSRREAPLTEFERGYVRDLLANLRVNSADPATIEGVTLHVVSEEVLPTVMDIPLGREHIRFVPRESEEP